MKEIYICELYKDHPGNNEKITVSDEIYELITRTFKNEEQARQRRILRNKASGRYVEGLSEIHISSIHDADTLGKLIIREELSSLNRAVNMLSELQRKRIRAYYMKELTLNEIAEKEGVSLQAVHDCLRHAIKKLKQNMENQTTVK